MSRALIAKLGMAALFLLVFGGSILVFYPFQEEPVPVAFVRFITDPGDFDETVIRTEALMLAAENNDAARLFLNKQSAKYNTLLDSVFVSPDSLPSAYKPLYQFNGEVVIIQGLFHEDHPYSMMDHVEKIYIVNPMSPECQFRYKEEKCGPSYIDPGRQKQAPGQLQTGDDEG